jgi:protein TonB
LGRPLISSGFDKIQYADGKEGFVASSYLEGPIATPGKDVTAPSPIYRPEPSYTPEARQDGIEGTLTFSIVIDKQGNVTDVQERSKALGDGLDQSAIDTLKTWKFNPATRGGVPVPVRVMVEISFRLH